VVEQNANGGIGWRAATDDAGLRRDKIAMSFVADAVFFGQYGHQA
jgi:hypothetical protein